MKLALTTATLVLLCAAAAPGQVPAAPAAPEPAAAADEGKAAVAREGFEHIVPGDSFGFFGIADVDALQRDMAASTWGRLWADPACDSMRAGFRQQWEALGALVKEEIGVDALHLTALVHGRFALAVTGLPDLLEDGDKGLEGFGMALFADFGADADEARQIVEQLVDKAGETPDTVRGTETVGETEVTVLHPETSDVPGGIAIRVAFHDDTLVVLFGGLEPKRDVMGPLIEGLDGHGGAEVLADRPGFRDSVAAQPGGVQSWLDLAQAVDLGRAVAKHRANPHAAPGEELADADSPIADMPLTDFLRRLGVMGVGPLATNGTWDASGMRMRLHLALPGSGWIQDGLRLLLGPGAVGHPASVAADVKSMTAMHVDFEGLFDQVLRTLIEAQIVPPDEVATTLAAMEESLGFDLKEDLLAQLDGQVTVVFDNVEAGQGLPGTEQDPVNVAVLFGLKDGKSFNGVIEDLIRSRGMHAARKQAEFQGHQVYSLPLTPFEANYSVLPDALVVSMSSTMVQDVLRYRASPDLPTLATSDDYKAMLATVRSQPGMLSYGSSGKGLSNAFNVMTKAFAAGVMAGTKGRSTPALDSLLAFVSGLQFPEQAVVDKYFHGGSVSAVTVDESGISAETYQP